MIKRKLFTPFENRTHSLDPGHKNQMLNSNIIVLISLCAVNELLNQFTITTL